MRGLSGSVMSRGESGNSHSVFALLLEARAMPDTGDGVEAWRGLCGFKTPACRSKRAQRQSRVSIGMRFPEVYPRLSPNPTSFFQNQTPRYSGLPQETKRTYKGLSGTSGSPLYMRKSRPYAPLPGSPFERYSSGTGFRVNSGIRIRSPTIVRPRTAYPAASCTNPDMESEPYW